ncbi:hypothetical protein N0V94_008139 [Neodidymelliopsis sp. IMI 364377]|nr:hypothetical protein N0V94_008139 [Neodidymelliopsis sp. IMI 364377]
MLHTPNLVSLEVEDGHISAYSKAKWPELIKKATTGEFFGHTHRFSTLRSVRIDAQNMVIHHLVPLLRLQSLRLLHLRELSEIELDMRAPAELRRVLPASCNNLEELILEECSLRFDALKTLISSARRLKTFRFDLYSEKSSAVMLQKALWQQRDSLESLDTYYESYPFELVGLDNGGLQKFSVLSNLKCPISMVVDLRAGTSATILEFLPPSLVNLCLLVRRDTGEENFMHVLERMASDYITVVPGLKVVRLIVQVPADDMDYDWERLVKSFSETGVELIIDLPSESDDEWGDWRTVSSDSDDSSNSSDEVDLYSDNDSDEEMEA